MAKYEQPPIYKKGLDLAVYLEQVVHGLSRRHKHALDARLQARLAVLAGALFTRRP